MTPFDRLHPAVQHHVVNSLGWRRLRPLQEAAIEPLLAGSHALLLAPTAGGKTEAAVLPVLSRLLTEDWRPLGVIYLCPIKALLNNLELRLSHYAGLVGRRVAVWHGDVGEAARRRATRDPPDLLLTTPESLEVMLVSSRLDHRDFFANVRTVIVDEIHAFADDDRGWHLVAVLDRIARLSRFEIQRLGLSATVGNPEDLLRWLTAADPGQGGVIAPEAAASGDVAVELDYVGNLANAALVVSRLHRGEKRLVFCDSRTQVESLAADLRGLGVRTFVSHSSLSADERRRAESAFAEGEDCVIVATSTLELGVDVGDLDRVIQIDAPYTVSAFLQRLGRTGRRAGGRRNCLFLATREDAFLRALGLLHLWSEGYVEPVIPPPRPYHVLAQQIMTLALQEQGIGRRDWPGWLSGLLSATGIGAEDRDALVEHMLAQGYLFEDQGILAVGPEGEKRYGRRHFMELFSVFDSAPLFTVYHGREELGAVHQLTFQVRDEGPIALTLGGRHWLVTHLDWPKRRAYVQPTEQKGHSRWVGGGQPLHFALCQAILARIAGAESEVRLSRRASELLEELRAEFAWSEPDGTALVQDQDKLAWWTFAGRLLNAALAQRLEARGLTVSHDNLAIRFRGVDGPDEIRPQIRALLAESTVETSPPLAEEAAREAKFAECVPPALLGGMLRMRLEQGEAWRELKKDRFRSVGVVKQTGS